MKKKGTIVLATESFYPVISGVAVIVERLANYLIKRGYRVAVLTPSRNHALVREERGGYTIYRIPSWPMPFRKGLRSTFFPDRLIKQILLEEKPSLIHFHDPALLSYAAVRFARRQRIPLVANCHFSYDLLFTYLSPQLANITQRLNFRLYRQSDLLIVPTESLKAELLEEGLTDVPITVASNGVEFTRFAKARNITTLRKSLHIPEGVPVIGYIGNINPEKNIDVLLRACQLLVQRGVQFRCLLMGGGHSKEDMQELAESLGLNKHVLWLKRVDHGSERLVEVMQLLDLFCIPSTIETESIVTMEAMSANTPVIGAQAKALKELITDGREGYLLELDDTQWADCIADLLAHEQRRKKMGERAQRKMKKKDLRTALERFESLYKHLMH